LHHTKSGGDSPEKRDCPEFEAGKTGYKKIHPESYYDEKILLSKENTSTRVGHVHRN
jgi:hypothetical protein